jgi:ssRNA-specific RNase YbeY (16S rRNA maturation enzyme)
MNLKIKNSQNKIKIDRHKIRGTLGKITKILDCADKEISLCFVDDEKIKQLNKKYLSKDKSTNVLSCEKMNSAMLILRFWAILLFLSKRQKEMPSKAASHFPRKLISLSSTACYIYWVIIMKIRQKRNQS